MSGAHRTSWMVMQATRSRTGRVRSTSNLRCCPADHVRDDAAIVRALVERRRTERHPPAHMRLDRQGASLTRAANCVSISCGANPCARGREGRPWSFCGAARSLSGVATGITLASGGSATDRRTSGRSRRSAPS
jgi:hypothetical protein